MYERVQIPAYTDRWMRGDMYGTIVDHSLIPWERIHTSIRPRGYVEGDRVELAHVKLDKSGKVVKVILNDCTPV